MSVPFSWDQMKEQKFPPEYIGRVKEEHAHQTELTAESLMVIAHEVTNEANDRIGAMRALQKMEQVLRVGAGVLGQEKLNEVLPILVSGQRETLRLLGRLETLLATLATELARMKLKEIKVE